MTALLAKFLINLWGMFNCFEMEAPLLLFQKEEAILGNQRQNYKIICRNFKNQNKALAHHFRFVSETLFSL